MAMDQYNYVAPMGDGRFILVIDGELQGYYNSQQQAEALFDYAKNGGAPGSAYVPPNSGGGSSPYTGPVGSTGGGGTGSTGGGYSGGGTNIVGGGAQVDQHMRELELAQRQKEFEANLALDTQRLGLSQQEIDERRRQFDISQKEFARQFDASQGQQNQQYWAGLLGSLSGPRDWMKYQMAQAGAPQGTVQGGPMDVYGQPAFGAVAVDPSNSWENSFASWLQGGGKPSVGEVSVGGMPYVKEPGIGMNHGNSQWQTMPYVKEPGFGGGASDTQYNMGPGQGLAPAVKPQNAQWQAMQGGYQQKPQTAQSIGASASRPWLGKAQEISPNGGQLPNNGFGPAQEIPPYGGGSQLPNGGFGPPQEMLPYGSDNRDINRRPKSQLPWYMQATQPTQISRGMYNSSTPTQRAMMEGTWSANSMDPSDMWNRMQNAFPQGRAQQLTQWR